MKQLEVFSLVLGLVSVGCVLTFIGSEDSRRAGFDDNAVRSFSPDVSCVDVRGHLLSSRYWQGCDIS